MRLLSAFSRVLKPALAGSLGLFPMAASAEPGAPQNAPELNLAIALVLDGVYLHESRRGNQEPAGFAHGGHDHDDHEHGFERGFNLGHSELAIEARLGDLLDGYLMLGFDDQDLEVEEAYLLTRALPAGWQLKGGKFLSDIGYMNSRHSHDWDFIQRPLVNQYLFGAHGLQDLGVQIAFTPASPWYTRLGIEVLQGDEEGLARFDKPDAAHAEHEHEHDEGYPAPADHHEDEDDHSGQGAPYRRDSGPRLITAFIKTGPDLGPDHALQLGASAGYASQVSRLSEHGHHAHALEGDAWFAGLDAVYRFDAGRGYGEGNWRVAGEYFLARRDLHEWVAHDDHWERRLGHVERQDGVYVEAVYGIAPRWQAGVRAEALGLTNRVVEFHPTGVQAPDTSYRYAAQLTYRPIEPLFLRAQLTYDDLARDPHDDHDHGAGSGLSLMFQVNVALGAHAAHRF
jgi:hypothetical protein